MVRRNLDAGPNVGNLEHDTTTNSQNVTGAQILAFIQRVERMEEEKKAIADDIKEIYTEAKGNGFDTKILRLIVRRRKQDAAERAEQEALLDTYEHAIGMRPEPEEDDDYEETVVAEFRGVVRKDADGNIVDEGMRRTK